MEMLFEVSSTLNVLEFVAVFLKTYFMCCYANAMIACFVLVVNCLKYLNKFLICQRKSLQIYN